MLKMAIEREMPARIKVRSLAWFSSFVYRSRPPYAVITVAAMTVS